MSDDRHLKIYIPLWLYSNHSDDVKKLIRKPFTFHYGYILIILRDPYQVLHTYLHSTMVIF